MSEGAVIRRVALRKRAGSTEKSSSSSAFQSDDRFRMRVTTALGGEPRAARITPSTRAAPSTVSSGAADRHVGPRFVPGHACLLVAIRRTPLLRRPVSRVGDGPDGNLNNFGTGMLEQRREV